MKEIVVINNFVRIPSEDHICCHNTDNVIIFLGKMNYEPNVTAVTFFANNIFPKLKKRFHDLKFMIIGSSPTKGIYALNKINGIEVTGFVESTEPYFRNATIVVAPMLSGAGVQNKIIQAMSYGCCVATSKIGAEGLNLNGDEIVILDEQQWVDGISDLLMNKEHRKKYGVKARENIKKNLSKEVIYTQFCHLIEE